MSRNGDELGRFVVAPSTAIAREGDVFKNDSLAFVELEMKAAGIVDFGTRLHNPDFAKIADGAGMLAWTAKAAHGSMPVPLTRRFGVPTRFRAKAPRSP